MFKLEVRFKGLCTFAPKYNGSEAKVFLPNGSRPSAGITPHHGAIKIAAKYLKKDEPQLPGEFVWFLTEKRIRILPPPSTTPKALEIEGFDDLEKPKQPSLVRRPKDGDGGFW